MQAQQRKAEPFLKWAGGKRLLLDGIAHHLPAMHHGSTYFEPFLGGGAVFFGIQPDRAVLSDSNEDLIQVYKAVRDRPEDVIGHLRVMPHSEEFYYQLRSARPAENDQKAARFIYLNKTCFNGLYRVNLRGEFNVPFGRHGKGLVICDEAQIMAASEMLKNAELMSADFAGVTTKAKAGDVVYFDPPYTNAHSDNGFVEYNARVFSWGDQDRLLQEAIRLVKSEVFVVISNGDHQSIVDSYSKCGLFNIERIARHSTMAGSPSKRRATTELVIVGNPQRRSVNV